MRVKIFYGSPTGAEKEINRWLDQGGVRFKKLHASSAICEMPGCDRDNYVVTIVIEYEPL